MHPFNYFKLYNSVIFNIVTMLYNQILVKCFPFLCSNSLYVSQSFNNISIAYIALGREAKGAKRTGQGKEMCSVPGTLALMTVQTEWLPGGGECSSEAPCRRCLEASSHPQWSQEWWQKCTTDRTADSGGPGADDRQSPLLTHIAGGRPTGSRLGVGRGKRRQIPQVTQGNYYAATLHDHVSEVVMFCKVTTNPACWILTIVSGKIQG